MGESLFRPKILERKRVDKLLEEILETPLFYLSASMGYGKTTAVKSFLDKRKDINAVWIPIPNAEEDEKWLWHRCCSAVEKYNPSFAEKFMKLSFPRNELEMKHVLEVVKAEVKKPTVVVIDDYQEVKSETVTKLLTMHAQYGIPNIHIVVISRMRPATEFLMLNIKHQCLLMWQREIAFTKEETAELFELNGFSLSEQELEELYSYTIGWIAPTYLVLLDYASHQNISVIAQSAELIKTAVYDQLDEEAQHILMMLAPVEKFTLEMGEYITEDKRVNEVIKDMLINNCFIHLTAQTKEYQFHTLFRHTLLEELRKTNLLEEEIYNKCAAWYKMNGNPLNAIEYYHKAKNNDAIFEMMSEMGATEYIDIAPKLISDIFRRMSLEEKLSHPIGYLTFIHSYLVSAQNEEAYRLLCEAKAYYEEHQEIENWNHIMGEIKLIESFMLLQHPFKMLENIIEAYHRLKDGKSLISGPHMIWTCGNLNAISLFHSAVGRFEELRDFIVENIDYFKHVANGCATGAKYLIQAQYAYEVGNIENAKTLAVKAIYRAEAKAQISIILDAYFVLIRISLIQNHLDDVDGYMSDIEKRVSGRSHPMIHGMVEFIRGYIYGIANQYDKVPGWTRDFDMKDGMSNLPNLVTGFINLGLALLHKGEYIQLEVLMETSLEEYKKAQYIYGMIQTNILWAIAKEKLYDEEDGAETLKEAIDLAQPDQIIMPFVELRDQIRGMLEILAKDNELAKHILEYDVNYGANAAQKNECMQGAVSLLTEREKEVMQYFVKGYKQSEIAKELQISIDTVKRHIKNVYGKLEVHSKVELIEKLGNVIE